MQIENAQLLVKAKKTGAELILIFDKRDHTEHLWQANPSFWAAHAPVLFPIVGRCYNDTLTFNGVQYTMEKHGFARRNEFVIIAHEPTSITFALQSNEQLKTMYPFDFCFTITYSLHGDSLKTTYVVENKSTVGMPFALGAHPAFAVPFFAGEAYDDYVIEFPNDDSFTRHHINKDGLFDGRTSSLSSNGHAIGLTHQLFNEDALIFKDLKSKEVMISSKKHQKKLRVSFDGFPYLGLWAKPGADYVCIEPWMGCADADGFSKEFTQKEEVIVLEAGEIFQTSFFIQIA